MSRKEKKPSEVFDHPWIFEKGSNKDTHSVGKWMLFYPKEEMDDMWKLAKKLFRKMKLDGVIAMKCSTMLENSRSSDHSKGIIIFYCNNSKNEKRIMKIGNIIIDNFPYDEYYVYYKTDAQTTVGTRATGVKKNWTYRLIVKKKKNLFEDIEFVSDDE